MGEIFFSGGARKHGGKKEYIKYSKKDNQAKDVFIKKRLFGTEFGRSLICGFWV